MTYNPYFGYDFDQVLSTITPEKHAFRLAQVLHCMEKWAKAHPAATTEQREAAANRYRGYFFTPKHIGYFAQVRITKELSQRDDLNPAFDLKDWSCRQATEVLVDVMKNNIAEQIRDHADPSDPFVLRQSFKSGRDLFLANRTERSSADWVRGAAKHRARAFMMGYYFARMLHQECNGEKGVAEVWRQLSNADLDEAIAQGFAIPEEGWHEDNTGKAIISTTYQDYIDAVKLGIAGEQLTDWHRQNPNATEEQSIAAAQRNIDKYGRLYVRSYPGGPRRLMSPENQQLAIAERAAYEAMQAPGATEEEKKVAASRLIELRAVNNP